MRMLAALLVLSSFCLHKPLVAAEPVRPTTKILCERAEQCRQILKTNIVSFYLPACVDQKNGGYLEWLDGDKFAPTGQKFLTLQARQLWFFSTIAAEGIEKDAALRAARSGFDFIQSKFRDSVHGGYFAMVSDEGSPADRRKHVYLNSFTLYSIVAYYRASNDPTALNAAQSLFRTMEEKCYDKTHGGYVEFFEENWTPILDRSAQSFIGKGGTKTYNTHLHVLEAFTELYRVWPDPLVRQRLEETLLINTQTVRLPEYGCNVDGFTPEWTPIQTPENRRASYGHDVEGAWLCLDAARALSNSPRLLRGWAEGLVSYSLQHGYDNQHGGFYNSGPLGKASDDTNKVWWVQAEALVALLELYKLSGDVRYYQAFEETLSFITKHQLAPGGSWWTSCQADGTPLNNLRTSMWQGGYHNGRAMILSAALLDELAKGAK